MKSAFARDLADQDRPILAAASERPGKPILVRLQPMILRGARGDETQGSYRAWKDVRWTLECETPEEVFAVRDALRAFFQVINAHGPEATTRALAAAGKPQGKPQQTEVA